MARLGDRSRLEELVASLEACNPHPEPFEVPELLLREWQLLTTFQPGTADVRFFDPESWRKYLFEQGPSPVQSLVVGNRDVDNVFQVLEDPRLSTADSSSLAGSRTTTQQQQQPKWQNVVEFGPPGTSLVIEAVMEGVRDANSFYYRFSGGFFQIDGALGGPDGLRLPYPVPFDLLAGARFFFLFFPPHSFCNNKTLTTAIDTKCFEPFFVTFQLLELPSPPLSKRPTSADNDRPQRSLESNKPVMRERAFSKALTFRSRSAPARPRWGGHAQLSYSVSIFQQLCACNRLDGARGVM